MPLPTFRQSIREPGAWGLRQWSGVLLGPLLLLMTLLLPPPAGLEPLGWKVAGVALMMAVFWVSECLPVAVTALLPLVLFPLLGIAGTREIAAPYANPLIFLFLGGFLLAQALQRWNLHRRVALWILSLSGTRPRGIVGGFMLACAAISMWVSNTATAIMMLPVALSILALMPEAAPFRKSFAPALLLALAYGCTIGGVATLIGTPPNALLAAYLANSLEMEIGFVEWMLIGGPLALIGLVVGFVVLGFAAFRLGGKSFDGFAELIERERSKVGVITAAEKRVGIVFLATATLWLLRPWLDEALPLLSDTTIAIAAVIALFVIPVDFKRGQFLMDLDGLRKLPWDILILFGGGLALAMMIDQSGLSRWLGQGLEGLAGAPSWLLITVLVLGILFLTELTSNTATTATFLPVAAAVAVANGALPTQLLVPTALAASCAFMMPVGTPPNAVIYGSGQINLTTMMRVGILMNLLFVPLIVLASLYLAPWVL